MTDELDVERAQNDGQQDLDAVNRRSMLSVVLDNVNGRPDSTAHLVLLADVLGLNEELEALVDGHPERHRRLADVRQELEELAVARVSTLGKE